MGTSGVPPPPPPPPPPPAAAAAAAAAAVAVAVDCKCSNDSIDTDTALWPPAICNLIARAWQANPSKRPTSTEVAMELGKLQQEVEALLVLVAGGQIQEPAP